MRIDLVIGQGRRLSFKYLHDGGVTATEVSHLQGVELGGVGMNQNPLAEPGRQ